MSGRSIISSYGSKMDVWKNIKDGAKKCFQCLTCSQKEKRLTVSHIVPVCLLVVVFSLFGCVIGFFIQDGGIFRLPAISETGIYPPVRYLLTFVLILSGMLLCIGSIFLGTVQSANIKRVNGLREKPLFCLCKCCNLLILNYLSCFVMFISGIGLAGLGLFPIEEQHLTETNPVAGTSISVIHLSFTGTFFVCFFIHMILQTIISFCLNKGKGKKKLWAWFKLAIVVETTIHWFVVPLFFFMLLLLLCDTTVLSKIVLDEDYSVGECVLYDVYNGFIGGFNQYCLIICVVVFSGLYIVDFGKMDIEIKLKFDDQFVPLDDEDEDMIEERETEMKLTERNENDIPDIVIDHADDDIEEKEEEQILKEKEDEEEEKENNPKKEKEVEVHESSDGERELDEIEQLEKQRMKKDKQ